MSITSKVLATAATLAVAGGLSTAGTLLAATRDFTGATHPRQGQAT
jgi:hypothetical protein